jgi:hypothetical protein
MTDPAIKMAGLNGFGFLSKSGLVFLCKDVILRLGLNTVRKEYSWVNQVKRGEKPYER